MNSKKKTGSYYTPLDLADFIVQHLKPSLNDTNSILVFITIEQPKLIRNIRV